MQRWNSLSDVPGDLGACVVTMGNFDGVHRGHLAVLAQVVEEARRRGILAVAITFDPHPLAVLRPEHAPERVTSPEQRDELLAETGLDGLLVMEFTRALAQWSPERFVREVMVDTLGAQVVVVGEDARFGHRNSGDVSTLRELGVRHGFEVVLIRDLGDGGERWSSTQVRSLLRAGDVRAVGSLLGRPHTVTGTVVHGAHRGRELGYPTANLSPDSEGMVPADGVYAGWLVRHAVPTAHPDRVMPCAVSVGTNPTFDGDHRTVEAYVLDRTDLDLYDERVSVEFVEHLRGMVRFDGIEPLLTQMAEDVVRTRAVLSTTVPGRFSRTGESHLI